MLLSKVTDKITLFNSFDLKRAQFELSHRVFALAGIPLVNVDRAARYIFDKLVYHGFTVAILDVGHDERMLDIAWLSSQDASLREKFHGYRLDTTHANECAKQRYKREKVDKKLQEENGTAEVDLSTLDQIANMAV